MKYDRIRENLIEILNAFGYNYSIYDAQGKKITNPYKARYIFVDKPNMMFIVDDSKNRIEFHKSNFDFNTFKKILRMVRRISMEFFVNLEVSNYNHNFKPKDFSRDIMRRRLNLDREAYSNTISESKKDDFDNNRFEIYDGIKCLFESTQDNIVIKYNGQTVSIPKKLNENLGYIVDNLKSDGMIDKRKIDNLKRLHQVKQTLDKKVKSGIMTEKDKLAFKEMNKIYTKVNY